MKTRQGDITLNDHEQTRIVVLTAVVGGTLSRREAAASLGVTERQVRRLLAAYRQQGVSAVVHGNRGRRPAHATAEEVVARVVALARTTYAGCNQQHLRDLLAEREGISLSRATVHRLLTQAGVLAPPRQRPPQHRRRRERRQQEGQLVQIDGSPHAWLEERGPRLTLLGAIDDATGALLAAVFRAQEDAAGYFLLMQQLLRSSGRPLALYHDRHSIFRVLTGPQAQRQRAGVGVAAPLEDQLAGRVQPLTQFGRLLEELEVASIAARSPQAKGRIERLWGTLQDRLVVELRLAGVSDEAAANTFLAAYLPRFNAQFAVPAALPGSAFRPLDPAGLPLEHLCCFKYGRTVAADNTVTFGDRRLQVLPDQQQHGTQQRRSYAHAPVEVHEHLDGQLSVLYGGTCLHTTPAPLEAPLLRARHGRISSLPASASAAREGGEPPRRPLAKRGGSPPGPAGPPRSPASSPPRSRPAATHPWRRPLTSVGASGASTRTKSVNS